MDLHLQRLRHPSGLIQASGIGLHSAYVEHCWLPVVGPSVVALLRRSYDLTVDGPMQVDSGELGRLLGFGKGRHEPTPSSHLGRTLARAHHYGLGRLSLAQRRFGAYEAVGPVPVRVIDRLPAWSRRRHAEELDRVTERLVAAGVDMSSAGASWRTSIDATPLPDPETWGHPRSAAAVRGDPQRLDALSRRSDSGHLDLSCG